MPSNEQAAQNKGKGNKLKSLIMEAAEQKITKMEQKRASGFVLCTKHSAMQHAVLKRSEYSTLETSARNTREGTRKLNACLFLSLSFKSTK